MLGSSLWEAVGLGAAWVVWARYGLYVESDVGVIVVIVAGVVAAGVGSLISSIIFLLRSPDFLPMLCLLREIVVATLC